MSVSLKINPDGTFSQEIFITKDTYITNDNIEPPSDINFLRVGRGNGFSVTQALLETFGSNLIPQDHFIVDLQLCLYQYYAYSNSAPIDQFRINLINESWNDGVTVETKPEIGKRLDTMYFSSSESGKECFNIDTSHIEDLTNSFGVIISGGIDSSKKERWLTSSQFLSKSRNVSSEASSNIYHPHWVVTTENRPIPANSMGRNGGNGGDGSYQTGMSLSLVIFATALVICAVVAMVGGIFLLWRKKSQNSKRHLNQNRTRSQSFDDIFSVHDPQLKDIFGMNDKGHEWAHVEQFPNNANIENESRLSTIEEGQKLRFSEEVEEEETRKKENRSSRHISETFSNETFNTQEMLESKGEPCLIDRVCLKVVNRKQCDIDYVAPGVASVVDKQCAPRHTTSSQGSTLFRKY
jgi:hypothetical protein